MTTTRRDFLLLGARIGAGGCVHLVLGGCGPNGDSREIDISAVLLEPKRVRLIGNVYRRKYPRLVSNKDLERRVFDGLPTQQSVSVEVKSRLAKLIREDFATERTFLFRRWMLSHTEGQLCALALN